MLQHQFLSEWGWRRKVNVFQPPKKVHFSFDHNFSSNGRLSRKLYGRLPSPKRLSLNHLNPYCAGENLPPTFGQQIPSGNIPSYISKFVNHLMVGGKKGTAIHLFIAALHLFFKRLEEEKRLGGSEKRRFPIKNAALFTLLSTTGVVNPRSDGFSSKSLMLPVNSSKPFSFSERPGKNLLGLAFSFPSTFLTDDRISILALKKQAARGLFKNREDKVFQEALSFTRKMKPLEKRISIVQNLCISTVSPPFALNHQVLISGEKHSITSDASSNTLLFQPMVKNQGRKAEKPSFNPGVSNTSWEHSSLLSCLEFAVKNVEPSLEVRKKKIAGITRQIPCTVPKARGEGLAIRWIISAAQGKRRKEGKAFSKSLAEELVNAYYKRGEPRQKRDSLHKVAESNRSFLRYRWW